MTVVALVGAQYGSEGKGAIAKVLAPEFDVHIRTGGPNAGHTIYVNGRKWAMRSIPCGWVNHNAHLMIGPGALIDLDLLHEEVDELEKAGYSIADRLYVDERAGIIDPVRHREFEGGVRGKAHEKIGSTGEGVGVARMARLARGTFEHQGITPAWAKIDFASSYAEDLSSRGIRVCDTVTGVHRWMDIGARVLLEGTQGSGLSLIHGHWPYVTSHDTNAAQLLVDAGLAPADLTRTLLVARTFPIRVAGNSGPMRYETTWDEVGVESEHTTVTGKVRRVGHWDLGLVRNAVRLNRSCDVALTFLDYWFPEEANKTDWNTLSRAAQKKVRDVEREIRVPIAFVGTGPDTVIDRRARPW